MKLAIIVRNGEFVWGSYGRADKVRMQMDDYIANEVFAAEEVMVVRIPRRFVLDRFRTRLLEQPEGGFYPCGSNSPYWPGNCEDFHPSFD